MLYPSGESLLSQRLVAEITGYKEQVLHEVEKEKETEDNDNEKDSKKSK